MTKAHGIMFHHFHGDGHLPSQGSISAAQLELIIDSVDRSATLLNAKDWFHRASTGTLDPLDVCLTFDDSLRCQVDVAVPVLRARGIGAFFFVYSSVLEGIPEKLEIYRYVRNACFAQIDDFYDEFDDRVLRSSAASKAALALERFDPTEHYVPYSFYSDRDKRYRFLRDTVLTDEEHAAVMDEVVSAHVSDSSELARHLWMTSVDINRLHEDGHVIGLHSYSHPTNLARLDRAEQAREYAQNKAGIEAVIREPVTSMSHPCNSYGPETLELLATIGIRLGFRDNMADGPFGLLEAPRMDHVDVWNQVK